MPNTGKLSDKDLAERMLNNHKLAASHLTQLILEAANESLRHDYINILQKTFDHQKQLWDLMNKRGWYQVQAASQQEIARAQSQYGIQTQG
ncbi:MAG: spore coat protein [Syntrophothermus sp.]